MARSNDKPPPVPAQRFLQRTTTPSQLAFQIFVSHSNEDNNFGVKLVQDLRQVLGNDEAVWYDKAGGLYGGDSWWGKIVQEVSERSIFIIVLSPNAMNSKWVIHELDMAMVEGKRIIPVLYSQCKVRTDLKTIQMISFLPPKKYETAFNELLLALGLSTHFEPQKTKDEYVNEGREHHKAKRYKKALAAYNHALELDLNDPYIYGRRADTYRALGEYEHALQDFDRAFELNPESATAWAYATRGRVYYGMKQYQKALDDFNRAYQLDPTSSWVNRWRNETIDKLTKQ